MNRKSSQLLLGLLALIASCPFAYWMGYTSNAIPVLPLENEGLIVDKTCLSFGTVWATKEFPWKMRIQNPTKNDIEIRQFWSSCSCLLLKPDSLLLKAGEGGDLNLMFDLAPTRVLHQSLHKVDVAITPVIKDVAARQKGWNIGGTVRSPLQLDSTPIELGEFVESCQPKTIMVKGTLPLKELKASCMPSIAHAQVTRMPGNDARFSLTLTPQGALPLGPLDFRVILQATGMDGADFPALEIPVAGNVRSDIQLLPSRICFGTCPVAQVVEEFIVAKSLSGKTFDISPIQGNSSDTSLQPIGPEGAHQYKLTQRISKSGAHVSIVQFSLRRPDRQPITIPIEVSYYGFVPKD